MHSGCPFFCCAVYFRWNYHCGQFSASCNIEIQKKLFFHKQALNHVWCTSGCPIFAVLSFWDEINIVGSIQQVEHGNAEISTFPWTSSLNHVWCSLDVQFWLCCLFEMKLTLSAVFNKLPTLKCRNKHFSINKL